MAHGLGFWVMTWVRPRVMVGVSWHNTFFLEIGPPRNANNIEPYTFVRQVIIH